MRTTRISLVLPQTRARGSGEAIEVIARMPAIADDATVWIFRGAVDPMARAEVEAAAAKATEVAWATLRPIGADNTDTGRAVYARGDRHAVITGNLDGEVTVCVAPAIEPASAVVCKRLTVKQSFPVELGETPQVGVTPGPVREVARKIDSSARGSSSAGVVNPRREDPRVSR